MPSAYSLSEILTLQCTSTPTPAGFIGTSGLQVCHAELCCLVRNLYIHKHGFRKLNENIVKDRFTSLVMNS